MFNWKMNLQFQYEIMLRHPHTGIFETYYSEGGSTTYTCYYLRTSNISDTTNAHSHRFHQGVCYRSILSLYYTYVRCVYFRITDTYMSAASSNRCSLLPAVRAIRSLSN